MPTVEGYVAPARTYVAPQSEKTVQKIYDLDQSGERPIVEKILPSQEQAKTVPPLAPVPLKSPPLEESPPKPDAAASEEPLGLLEEKAQQNPPQTEVNPASQGPNAKPAAATPPKSKAPQRIQIGPVFDTLTQAKVFFARLNAKAPGYRFSLQARKVKNVTRYRIVNQNPLTPAQIQALTQRVASLSS